jgi:hypothetical protein
LLILFIALCGSNYPFFIHVSPIAKNNAKNGVQYADNYLVDKVHK